MIDHIAIPVSDYEKSRTFYKSALAPLDYKLIMEHGISGGGFGCDNKPDFWIQESSNIAPIHIALSSKDRATVDAFYKSALEAGGIDNGEPGVRSEYHPTYYGAFIKDPDGHNIEAVCHIPE
ncbi:MAG: VOC family protein [Oceanicoccus sp.]